MEILRTIALYTESKALPFLVIGGHAVNSYGISRQTGDLDLLVPLKHSDEWHALLTKLNYSSTQRDARFARYFPREIAAWPVDLMFVDDQTWTKMYEESLDKQIGVADVKVVSPRHLITLKIHALKHFQEHRRAKDYGDLLSLLRIEMNDITPTELEQLCQKYATNELFSDLKRDLKL